MLSVARRVILSRRNAASLLLVAGLLAVTAGTAGAGPGAVTTRGGETIGRGHRPEVYIDVPPPPDIYRQQGVYFYGKERVEVPGTVAVNVPPYVCDLDGETFSDKETFVAHLRTSHGELLGGIAAPFVVYEGQVHFVGR